MRELDRAGLDNWITGHYGEDQFSKYDPDEREREDKEETCPQCGGTKTEPDRVIGGICANEWHDDTDPMSDEPFEKENNV